MDAGGRARILVVEDDEAVLRLLVKALGASGYEVVVAENGLEALLTVEQSDPRPDLMIVDIGMPELDGLSFVRALKNQGDTRRIPVIFLTARTDPETVAESAMITRYYITKPFTLDDLMRKIRSALAG